MAPRPRRRRRSSVPGLTWRGSVAYWQRTHHRLPGGRVYKTLGTRDPELAASSAAAVNTLLDRGEWEVIRRWTEGELETVDLVRAVREGEYRELRRLHRDGIEISAAADAYLERVEATQSRRTVKIYGSIVRRAVDHFSGRRMHEVTLADAEAYLHAPQETTGGEPWSARSQSTRRVVLGAWWQHAIEREADAASRTGAVATLTVNPWKRAKVPRIRRTRVSYLTPEEARELLAHPLVAGAPVHALLATAIFAGLRLGELSHLRTDVDVVLPTASAEGAWLLIQSRGGDHAWQPKTERGERNLRVIPTLRTILLRHREAFAGERYFFAPERHDKPPGESAVRLWVIAAFAAAGIKYGREGDALTLHSLRHTYATWQLSAGVPVTTVAKRMGDAPEVVLRTYAHVMPDDERRADQVLEDIGAAADRLRAAHRKPRVVAARPPGAVHCDGGAVKALQPWEVLAVAGWYAMGEKPRQIARRFGVSPDTVRRALRARGAEHTSSHSTPSPEPR